MQTISMQNPVETNAYQIGSVLANAVSETFDIALRIGHLNEVELTGTVSIIADTDDVVGVSTLFTTELSVGDQIKIGDETKVVASIEDDTHLTLTTNHIAGATDATAYRVDFILDYEKTVTLDSEDYQDLLPEITAMVIALIPKINL
ncbi:MAG: hypothetical protein ACTSPB_05480 [Candidatus Thorarchaeota archaeon]